MAPPRKPIPFDKAVSVLRRLSVIERKYPEAEFATVVSRRDEFIPHLLQMLEEFVDNPESVLEMHGYSGHLAAMYLLAQFREVQALPLLLRLCIDTPALILEAVLNGAADEDLPAILASVSGGSIDALRPLAEARGVSPDSRSIALEAMTILYIEGVVTRAELVAYFSAYADKLRQGRDFRMWTPLASIASAIALRELREPLRWACEQNRVAPDEITLEELDDDLSIDPEVARKRCAQVERQHRIDNACERMRWLTEEEADPDDDAIASMAEQFFAEAMEELLQRGGRPRGRPQALAPATTRKNAGPNARPGSAEKPQARTRPPKQ